VIRARLARAYIDLNRDAWELDPAMFEDELPEFARRRTARVAAGLGAIARVAGEGRPIYARKLTFAEAKARIETAHRPYHDALDRLLAQARNAHGLAILVDWHSMPAAATRGHRARGGGPCDIVLGDRFGAACGPGLTGLVEKALEAAGLSRRPQHALCRRLHHRALWSPGAPHPRHPDRNQPRALYERDHPRAGRGPGAAEGRYRSGDRPAEPDGLVGAAVGGPHSRPKDSIQALAAIAHGVPCRLSRDQWSPPPGAARAKKKPGSKAGQFIREETPRKGRGGSAASQVVYRVRCETHQAESSTPLSIFLQPPPETLCNTRYKEHWSSSVAISASMLHCTISCQRNDPTPRLPQNPLFKGIRTDTGFWNRANRRGGVDKRRAVA
jgi:hypothetical protein